MMYSVETYESIIKEYSYVELLEEQARLFEYIPVLQKNAEAEKKGEYENIGFVSPSYIVRLSHYREYLVALERLLKKKEDDEESQKFREMIESIRKGKKEKSDK